MTVAFAVRPGVQHAAAPVTEKSRSPRAGLCSSARRVAAIWLVVSVPVLSEQMTVVQPRVSTDGRLHTQPHGSVPLSGEAAGVWVVGYRRKRRGEVLDQAADHRA